MTLFRHPRHWALWDVVFPPICSLCSRPLGNALLFCPTCWAAAPLVENEQLPDLKYVDMARAGYRFGGDDVVRAAVHALKYERLRLVARDMAGCLVSCLPLRFVESDEQWTSVPLHWARRMNRGFNQSLLLATELAALVQHEGPNRLLTRIRNTPTQTSLTRRERARNLKGAFRITVPKPLPKAVLLIDDVITTGATMDECAFTLKSAGVEWVGALAFALSVHR